MNQSLSISVIICTWNRSDLLKTTLESLALQVGCDSLDIEIIVVDNNSTDNTRSVIEEAVANWTLGQLRYAFEPCQGKQYALNTGIHLSRHPILAFSDDDVTFSNDWLSAIAQLFADGSVDLAGGKTQVIWPETGPPQWYEARMSAIIACVDLGDRRLDTPSAEYAPSGTNLIARRDLFDRVGLFSENHFRHMDYEFGMCCQRAGAHVIYDPSLLVYTPVAIEILTKRYFRRWSFKAGIRYGEKPNSDLVTLFGAPRWVYRQIVADLVYLITHPLHSRQPEFFFRELRIWRHVGTVTSLWRMRLTPQRYAKWVERRSQKKGNLY
jgi:glycosyltransferase involved in cell wall biosynthesis